MEDVVNHFRDRTDKLLHSEHVEVATANSVTSKRKFVKRLLGVSKYRVFLFSKSSLKSKESERDFPCLLLEEVLSTGSEVTLKFQFPREGTVYLFIKTAHASTIVDGIHLFYTQMTCGWPANKVADFSLSGAAALPPIDFGPANGFLLTYHAYCNLLNVVPKRDFINFVRDKSETGNTDLDLTRAPGVTFRTELSFDLIAICSALRFNTYFKGFEIRLIENRDVAPAIVNFLDANSNITRFVWQGALGENSQSPVAYFGLETNNYHQIQILQIKDVKIPPRMVLGLAHAIKGFSHLLKVFDISGCNLPTKFTDPLIHAFMMNWGMTLGLKELNMSNNNFSSELFVQFISRMRFQSGLKRLSIANTGISAAHLCLELAFMKLQYIDISDNRWEKDGLETIITLASTTQTLETLRLAGSSLPPELLGRLISSLLGNENITTLHLDISRCNIGHKDVKLVTHGFNGQSSALKSLDISDNGLRETGLLAFLGVMPQSITYLNISNNFTGKTPEAEEFAFGLGAMVLSHPGITHLQMASTSKDSKPLGRYLSSFIADLAKIQGSSLEELDISGHAIGDSLFADLCRSLRSTTVKHLKADGNNVTHNGLLMFLQMVKRTKSFHKLDWLRDDYERAPDVIEFRTLYDDIEGQCAENINFSAFVALANPFEFDLKWPTPQSLPDPLLQVPEQLAAITATLSNVKFEVDDDVLSPRASVSSTSPNQLKKSPSSWVAAARVDGTSPRQTPQTLGRNTLGSSRGQTHSPLSPRVFENQGSSPLSSPKATELNEEDESSSSSSESSTSSSSSEVEVQKPPALTDLSAMAKDIDLKKIQDRAESPSPRTASPTTSQSPRRSPRPPSGPPPMSVLLKQTSPRSSVNQRTSVSPTLSPRAASISPRLSSPRPPPPAYPPPPAVLPSSSPSSSSGISSSPRSNQTAAASAPVSAPASAPASAPFSAPVPANPPPPSSPPPPLHVTSPPQHVPAAPTDPAPPVRAPINPPAPTPNANRSLPPQPSQSGAQFHVVTAPIVLVQSESEEASGSASSESSDSDESGSSSGEEPVDEDVVYI